MDEIVLVLQISPWELLNILPASIKTQIRIDEGDFGFRKGQKKSRSLKVEKFEKAIRLLLKDVKIRPYPASRSLRKILQAEERQKARGMVVPDVAGCQTDDTDTFVRLSPSQVLDTYVSTLLSHPGSLGFLGKFCLKGKFCFFILFCPFFLWDFREDCKWSS